MYLKTNNVYSVLKFEEVLELKSGPGLDWKMFIETYLSWSILDFLRSKYAIFGSLAFSFFN